MQGKKEYWILRRLATVIFLYSIFLFDFSMQRSMEITGEYCHDIHKVIFCGA